MQELAKKVERGDIQENDIDEETKVSLMLMTALGGGRALQTAFRFLSNSELIGNKLEREPLNLREMSCRELRMGSLMLLVYSETPLKGHP